MGSRPEGPGPGVREWEGRAQRGSPGRRAGEGYCRRSPSTSLGSGPGSPAAAAASSCSSTNLFSSNSSMSTRRKREDNVFRAMAGARRPFSRLRSGHNLRSTPLQTGSRSGAGSGRPAPPPRAAAARPLPGHTGTGSMGETEGRRLWGRGWERGVTCVVVAWTPALDSHLRGASVFWSEELAHCPRAGPASWTPLLRSFLGLPPELGAPSPGGAGVCTTANSGSHMTAPN